MWTLTPKYDPFSILKRVWCCRAVQVNTTVYHNIIKCIGHVVIINTICFPQSPKLKKSLFDTFKCKCRCTVPDTERRKTTNPLAAAVKLIAALRICPLKHVRRYIWDRNMNLQLCLRVLFWKKHVFYAHICWVRQQITADLASFLFVLF